MKSRVLLWVVALVQILFVGVLTFNLESRLPVIKLSKESGSYFGYSVAEHQIVNEINNNVESW